MAHIQVYIKGLSINKDVLVAEEGLKNLRDSLLKQKSGESNYSLAHKTGKEYTNTEELEKDIQTLQMTKDKDFIRMEKWFSWATRLFIVCHCFLALGFVLLIYSKFVG
jgi:hypothetical protein